MDMPLVHAPQPGRIIDHLTSLGHDGVAETTVVMRINSLGSSSAISEPSSGVGAAALLFWREIAEYCG